MQFIFWWDENAREPSFWQIYWDLIDYVDLGDIKLNSSTFQDVNDLATHAIVYYVRGIASDFKFSLAYFATNDMTADQIMPTFWEAVAVLELICKLQVIATVSDGASPNRKFYRMHELMSSTDDSSVVYRTIDLYAPGRYIWFSADPSHFMKTTSKCIAHSGMSIYLFNKSTKMKIKNDSFIKFYNRKQ